jgi:hypothetical protein
LKTALLQNNKNLKTALLQNNKNLKTALLQNNKNLKTALLQNNKDLKTALLMFENNINQIIETIHLDSVKDFERLISILTEKLKSKCLVFKLKSIADSSFAFDE